MWDGHCVGAKERRSGGPRDPEPEGPIPYECRLSEASQLDIVEFMRIRSHDGSFDDSPRPAHRNRLMDPVLLHELHAAIEEIGHHRFAPAVTVAQAKHQARGALIAFGQQPLPMTVREATSVLGHRLDEIDADQPALAWEPLLRALQVLEREIAGGGGS